VLDILKRQGIDPSNFSWSETRSDLDPDKIISRLLCIHTDYFFSFEMKDDAHFAIFSPATHSYIGTEYPGTWENQRQCFLNWLQNLLKEKNELGQNPSIFEPESGFVNTAQKTYMTAEPSAQSPAPEKISSRLDALFENKDTFDHSGFRQKIFQSHIKRYYGKA
jgi:hypothetical protein